MLSYLVHLVHNLSIWRLILDQFETSSSGVPALKLRKRARTNIEVFGTLFKKGGAGGGIVVTTGSKPSPMSAVHLCRLCTVRAVS